MGNKLKDVFCFDNKVAARGIQRVVNQAYDGQWCTTCKNVYYTNNLKMKCRISKGLCSKRQLNKNDCSMQMCLFYKSKNREE